MFDKPKKEKKPKPIEEEPIELPVVVKDVNKEQVAKAAKLNYQRIKIKKV